MPGKGVLGMETANARGFADDLGRAESAAAGDGQQAGREKRPRLLSATGAATRLSV